MDLVITVVNFVLTLAVALLGSALLGLLAAGVVYPALLILVVAAYPSDNADDMLPPIYLIATVFEFPLLIALMALLWPAGAEMGVRVNFDRVTWDTPLFQTGTLIYGGAMLLPWLVAGLALGVRGLRTWSQHRDVPSRLPEWRHVREAERLLAAVDGALRHAPMSPEKKASLRGQAADVPKNIAGVVQKLHRLRGLRDLLGQVGAAAPSLTRVGDARETQAGELEQMERQLVGEIDHSLQALLSIPVTLMKVELARDDGAVDRLVADLAESNMRLKELASAYVEVKRPG